MRTFVFIVIDQLRFSDALKLAETRRLFGRPARHKIDYLPTLTESAHATMATLATPNRHGIIGAEVFCCDDNGRSRRVVGVSESPYGRERRGFGLSVLASRGADCFVVAGKRNVARLVDPRGYGGAATRVVVARDPDGLSVEALSSQGNPVRINSLPCSGSEVSEEELNTLLFAAADELLSTRNRASPAFLFLGTPIIDRVGHHFSRSSVTFRRALTRVDADLSQLVRRHSDQNTRFVVTADHGCRRVGRCITLSKDGSALEMWPAVNPKPNSVKRISLPVGAIARDDDGMPAVVFDGGTIRIWAASRSSRREVAEFLQRSLSGHLREVLTVHGVRRHRCSHENWGHVVGIAALDVALCKRTWMFRDPDAAVPTEEIVGEHGTNWSDDTTVPWWGPISSHVSVMSDAFGFLLAPSW